MARYTCVCTTGSFRLRLETSGVRNAKIADQYIVDNVNRRCGVPNAVFRIIKALRYNIAITLIAQ